MIPLKVESEELNIVSVWKNSLPIFQFRRQVHLTGSKIADFYSLSSAFEILSRQLNEEPKIKWTIHCSKPNDIQSLEKPENVSISVNTSLGD